MGASAILAYTNRRALSPQPGSFSRSSLRRQVNPFVLPSTLPLQLRSGGWMPGGLRLPTPDSRLAPSRPTRRPAAITIPASTPGPGPWPRGLLSYCGLSTRQPDSENDLCRIMRQSGYLCPGAAAARPAPRRPADCSPRWSSWRWRPGAPRWCVRWTFDPEVISTRPPSRWRWPVCGTSFQRPGSARFECGSPAFDTVRSW